MSTEPSAKDKESSAITEPSATEPSATPSSTVDKSIEGRHSWGEHCGPVIAEKDDISVIECEACKFSHIVPLPSADDKADFYENEFYESFSDDYISKHQEDLDWWKIEHREKYELFESILTPDAQPKTLLDIGSGPGMFLKVGQDRGWHVEGIEPGASAWKFSTENLGLSVHHAYLDGDNVDTFGSFDVVHLNNVLEHIVDASAFVAMMGKLVKPDGLIAITVPNDFNPLQEAVVDCFSKPQWWVSPLQHLNYFSPTSLETCLANNGFEPVKTTGSFPLELFLLMGIDYIGDGKTGRAVHEQRKQLEMNLDRAGKTDLKRKMYDALCSLGIGRQVTVVAKKVAEKHARKKDSTHE